VPSRRNAFKLCSSLRVRKSDIIESLDRDGNTDNVVVGRVADAFGIKGQIKVRSFTETPSRLVEFRDWWLCKASGSTLRYEVLCARYDGRFVIASLNGIEDRDRALELKGSDVCIPYGDLPQLADGEYYWRDLIGMTVLNADGLCLGTVARMMETGANDVLVVCGETEQLIPYVQDVITAINAHVRTIHVNWQTDY